MCVPLLHYRGIGLGFFVYSATWATQAPHCPEILPLVCAASNNSPLPHILLSTELQSNWLTVIPITQPLRPIVQPKAHISHIITCCILPPVCMSMSLCEMYCTRSKYAPFLMYSQGRGLKLFIKYNTGSNVKQNCTKKKKSWNRGRAGTARTWCHGSPYRTRGAEQTAQTRGGSASLLFDSATLLEECLLSPDSHRHLIHFEA